MAYRLAPQARGGPRRHRVLHRPSQGGSLETADRFLESINRPVPRCSGSIRVPADVVTICGPACARLPVGRYLVLYRVDGDDVLIQRVVRGSRDLEDCLGE